ncbi:MAG: hypothetical protein DMF86_19830 [Acidobacteria bacterium]|nr:MAG: hypothetical protein DMF86_19830 [Acidobacteriota bacterium]
MPGKPDAPFTVEPPVAQRLAPPKPETDLEALRAAPAARDRVAVFVCHGMGQQVRFQTIDGLATALHEYAERYQKEQGLPAPPKPAVRVAKLGSKELGRAELKLQTSTGTRTVHVYEGYWAPLTEGRITLRATVLFFLKSGWQGIRMSLFRRTFVRFLFGGFVSWPRSFRTPLIFLLALVLVSALIGINAVQAAVLLAWIGRGAPWLPATAIPQVTEDLLWLLIPASMLTILYGTRLLPRWRRGETAARRAIRRTLDALLYVGCVLVAAGIIGAASLMAVHLERIHRAPRVVVTADQTASATPAIGSGATGRWTARVKAFPWWTLVWIAVGGVSLAARWWILQFLGDVAIYLSAYRVSVFDALRDQIQDVCCTAARAVYEHGGYDQHVIVGHSLGSVIAYDTLNRLLLDEAMEPEKHSVRARTRGFITFGSPLDKTAYLFRAQADPRSQLREGLATAIQPLIANYVNRPEWVNLWSRADIISGRLDYYDERTDPANPIDNVVDPFATTPLAAHTQYWRGTELYKRLHGMIVT